MDPASVEAALTPSPEKPAPVPVPMTRGIEFRNVSFKYPGTDKWILRDVS